MAEKSGMYRIRAAVRWTLTCCLIVCSSPPCSIAVRRSKREASNFDPNDRPLWLGLAGDADCRWLPYLVRLLGKLWNVIVLQIKDSRTRTVGTPAIEIKGFHSNPRTTVLASPPCSAQVLPLVTALIARKKSRPKKALRRHFTAETTKSSIACCSLDTIRPLVARSRCWEPRIH